jgi:hypothetical protein
VLDVPGDDGRSVVHPLTVSRVEDPGPDPLQATEGIEIGGGVLDDDRRASHDVVAGEQQAVAGQEAQVVGRVPGRVDGLEDLVPHGDDVPVAESQVGDETGTGGVAGRRDAERPRHAVGGGSMVGVGVGDDHRHRGRPGQHLLDGVEM